MRNDVLGIAVFGEELDHAGGRFGAEQRALGSAHHFHAVETFRGDVLQVQLAAWIVERHAVEQDQRAGVIGAAREYFGQRSRRAILDRLAGRESRAARRRAWEIGALRAVAR